MELSDELCSYGLLVNEVERLEGGTWGTVVLDEAQLIKNASAQRFKAAVRLRAGSFGCAKHQTLHVARHGVGVHQNPHRPRFGPGRQRPSPLCQAFHRGTPVACAKVLPMTDAMHTEGHDDLERQARAEFGRRLARHDERTRAKMAQAMRDHGADPAYIYAFEKTGLLVFPETMDTLDPEELELWAEAYEEYSPSS